LKLKLRQAIVVRYCGRKMNSWILLGLFKHFTTFLQNMCVYEWVCVCVRKRVCVTYRKEINSLFKMGVGGGEGGSRPKTGQMYIRGRENFTQKTNFIICCCLRSITWGCKSLIVSKESIFFGRQISSFSHVSNYSWLKLLL